MQEKKTKTIKNIENKMEEMDEGSLRYKVLEHAKNFKTSWIDLGQTLFSVWKDKLYKEWGYSEFEAYTAKEIGIRKETALKLLRSYTFLEKEEPRLVSKDRVQEVRVKDIPSYEAVDVLRQASNKDLDGETYGKIRKYVLEDGKDAKFIKKDLTAMIKKKEEEEDPRAAKEKKKIMALRRLIGTLRIARTEIKYGNLLPEETIKKIDDIVKTLEAKLEKETADE
jgi:hypothetical protein